MREGNKVLEKKDELLGSAPLGPLILKMVLPAVTAQIFMAGIWAFGLQLVFQSAFMEWGKLRCLYF